jgi:hypothetical protein
MGKRTGARPAIGAKHRLPERLAKLAQAVSNAAARAR